MICHTEIIENTQKKGYIKASMKLFSVNRVFGLGTTMQIWKLFVIFVEIGVEMHSVIILVWIIVIF